MTREWIKEQLNEHQVNHIILYFSDVLGQARSIRIPSRLIDDACDDQIMFDGSSIKGFKSIEQSDMYLHPDLSTFKLMPHLRTPLGQTAMMICDVYDEKQQAFVGSPRYQLKRLLQNIKRIQLHQVNVGFEPEFYLFHKDQRVLIDQQGYCTSVSQDEAYMCRQEIVETLSQMGYLMETDHHEVGFGQQEINYQYMEALKAADALLIFREVVSSIASKHGFHASFMAKYKEGFAGNGMHANCSVFNEHGDNLFYDESTKDQLSDLAHHFIAGVLAHARPLCALTNSTVNSYKRLVPGHEAPCYIGYSLSNRSAFIRIPASRKKATRIEVRNPDPMGCPYLVLLGIISAGVDGIAHRLTSPSPFTENVFKLSKEQRKERGIRILPRSLHEAMLEFKQSPIFRGVLGDTLFDQYYNIKTQEYEAYIQYVSPYEQDKYL